MTLFNKLFNKKANKPAWYLTLSLNARVMPVDRGTLFEDVIYYALKKLRIGTVDGGGTLMDDATGEIKSCDIEIYLNEKSDVNYQKLQSILATLNVPKGSFLISEDERQEIGDLEGLAIYINGTDLDSEIYKSCDINYVIAELIKLLGSKHKYYSHWEGSNETALYFYGKSFDTMKILIIPFVEEYPLCQKSRITQIA